MQYNTVQYCTYNMPHTTDKQHTKHNTHTHNTQQTTHTYTHTYTTHNKQATHIYTHTTHTARSVTYERGQLVVVVSVGLHPPELSSLDLLCVTYRELRGGGREGEKG